MSKDKEKIVPINTERLARENPSMTSWVMGGAPDLIEHQERAGQGSFVMSTTLPTDIGRYGDYDAKTILEKAGVKFLGVVQDDPMFQGVELPDGWKKVPTGHSMWTDLVDEKGRKRAAIFYKAAFYDRSAHMSLERRYNAHLDYDREKKEDIAVAVVTDGETVIHTTVPIPLPKNDRKKYEVGKQATKVACAWLDKNFPDWRNPGAYWD